MKRAFCVLCFAFLILTGRRAASAQATRPDTVVGPLKDGWESIDQRLVFLTMRLSSIESSIDGVNKALAAVGFQRDKKVAEAEHAQGANDAMDQNGGGPAPWQTFYGNTAGKFFYHPTDNSTIHVNPIPIDQRPPQLDYIYKANSNAQERAQEQANDFGKKIDELLARRRHLQEQQSELWCRMSFRAIATRNISLKPLLRFDVTKADSDPTDLQRVAAIRSGAKFVRTVDQLMSQAQSAVGGNQGAVVDNLQKTIDAAYAALMKNLEEQQLLADDLGDSRTGIGKFAAAAQHLDDSSANIAEAYQLVREGFRSGDNQEAETFRAQLQQSYFDIAASLYTAEQCLTSAAVDWKVVPDTTRPGPQISADLGVKPNAGEDSPDVASSVQDNNDVVATYLSDMTPKSISTYSDSVWGFGIGGHVGAGDRLMTVLGKPSPHGLGTHPPSNGAAVVKYDLGGAYRRMTGTVAVDDAVGRTNSVLIFRIVGDGHDLWRSKQIQSSREPQQFDVDISDVKLLELVVDCPGEHTNCQAVWLEPKVFP